MISKVKRKINKIKFDIKLNHPLEKFKTKRYYKVKSAIGLKKRLDVPVSKILVGQQAGILLEKWVEQTKEYNRISVLIEDSAYVAILKHLDKHPKNLSNIEILKESSYFKMMQVCLKHTGHYMGIRDEEKLVDQIAYFYNMYKNFDFSIQRIEEGVNGRSTRNEAIRVKKLFYSDCYEIVDGHHRCAIYVMKGKKSIPVEVIDAKLSYLQRIVLNSKQTFNIELYQPIDKPEVSDWPTIRNCKDRLEMMFACLEEQNISAGSYIDLPCSYGYFVKAFKERGFEAHGLDIDMSSIRIAHQINGLGEEVSHKDIIKYLETTNDTYDYVSCLSILHHFVMGRIDYPYMNIVKNLDKITKRILFFDTGQAHEKQYIGELDGWDDQFIIDLFLNNSSFKTATVLGVDRDNIGLQKENNRRTLFAFFK